MATVNFMCERPHASLSRAWGVVLFVVSALLFGTAQADSTTQAAAPVRCDAAARPVSGCKSEATHRDTDGGPAGEADGPATGTGDDVDGRAGQIETMNQQIRMERRRKDSLLRLYPDEAAHNAARARDLAEKEKSIHAAEDRIDDLTRESKRLSDAAGLYAGKPVPVDLRNQSQHMEIALQDARSMLRNRRDERLQVTKTYDDELIVLRRLWAAQRRS